MEITNTTSKFEYQIEAKPDGSGFIAHPVGTPPANFPLGIIEGATREEVQEKIRAKIMEAVQEKIPTLFKFAGMNVAVNSTINVITKAAFKGASTIRQEELPSGSELNIPAPIVPSSSGGTMLRVLAFLIALILIYVLFVVRR